MSSSAICNPRVSRFFSIARHVHHTDFRDHASEPQATTSRWRTLTHMYARVESDYNAPAPAYPGSLTSSSLFAPSIPRPRTPSNASASSLADPSSQSGAHIRGILAILVLSGCTDERGVHHEPLQARFGEKLSHIAERTEALARILREGVSSAWFKVEVVVERPSVTPLSRSKGRGQGISFNSQAFDPTVMENVYAGYGSEECGVLCTVAFGLSVVKRRKEGEARRGQESAYLDTQSKADLLETTLLVKPKVLLESADEHVGKPTLIISIG